MSHKQEELKTPHTDDHSRRIRAVWSALETVADPEIPPLSVVDLGMIGKVHIADEGVVVNMLPTFVGCPALDLIRDSIGTAVRAIGESHVIVKVVFDPPWSTDRMSDSGRKKLKEFGLAPPGRNCGGSTISHADKVACPFCDSTHTEVESLFGPTLCRSIHYCHDCLQSFEHFKPV